MSQQVYLQNILPILPSIIPLLIYRGADMQSQTELIIDFFVCLLESASGLFSSDLKIIKSNLLKFSEQGVLRNLIEITQRSPQLNIKVFKLIRLMCKLSPALSISFLSIGASPLLNEALNKSDQSDNNYYLTEVLQLIETIIPASNPKEINEKERNQLFREHAEYILAVGEAVVPHIMNIYQSSSSNSSKSSILKILYKIIAIAPQECLCSIVSTQNLSSFLSEILYSQCERTVQSALRIMNICYEKIPTEIAKYFIREGLILRVNSLKEPEAIKKLKKDIDQDFGHKELLMVHKEKNRANHNYFEQLMLNLSNEGNMINLESQGDEFITRIIDSKSRNTQPLNRINIKSEVVEICDSILEKHTHFEDNSALKIGRSLKKLANKLDFESQESYIEI